MIKPSATKTINGGYIAKLTIAPNINHYSKIEFVNRNDAMVYARKWARESTEAGFVQYA